MVQELYPTPPAAEAPPPPMPPEPKPIEVYPGWDKERTKWEKEFEKTKKTLVTYEERVRTIETEFEKLQEPLTGWQGFLASTAGLVYASWKQQKQTMLTFERDALISQLGQLNTDLVRSNWYSALYEVLPVKIATGQITSFEDMMADPGLNYADMTAEDRAAAEDIFNKTIGALQAGVVTTPYVPEEGAPPTTGLPGTYDDIIDAMRQKPTVIPVGLDQLTHQEILRSLQYMAIPTLPPGAGLGEIEEAFREAGIPEDLIAEAEELSRMVSEWDDYWAQVQSDQEAVKAGLVEARMPEMTIKDWLLLAVTQPGLAAMDALVGPARYWIYPWAGVTYMARKWATKEPSYALSKLDPSQYGSPEWAAKTKKDFDTLYLQAKETDNWWVAAGMAFEEAELGFANRLIHEWVVDPLSWLGTGIPTKITRPIPLLGKFVAKFEMGWIKLWDNLIFDQIKKGLLKVPKTPMQTARSVAAADFRAVKNFIEVASGGRIYRKVPVERATELLIAARNHALKHPEDTGRMAQAGRAIMRQHDLTEASIKEMLGKTGGSAVLDKELITNVNAIFAEVRNKSTGVMLTRKTSPPFLLRALQAADTPENLKLAKAFINGFYRSMVIDSNALMKGAKNTPKIVANVYKRTQQVVWDSLQSAAAHNMEMTGMVASSVSRVKWTVMNAWRTTIDKWMVTPMARSYLVFGAYGPFNILEGYVKPALARIKPFWPKGTDPTKRGQKALAGIKIPLELDTAVPRLEMAAELPSIMDIETMSSALKKWRTVTSFGPMGKWLVEMPSRVGVQQRWNYYYKMTLRYLVDEAPETMKGLGKGVDDFVRAVPDDLMGSLKMSRDELRTELMDRAIAGPESVKSLIDDAVADRIAGVTPDMALENKIASGGVEEMIAKYTSIPAAVQDNCVTRAGDGRLWAEGGKGIGEFVEGTRRLYYDNFLHSPELFESRYVELAKMLMDWQPVNKVEFQMKLSHLQNMVDFFDESSSAIIREGRKAADELLLYEGTFEALTAKQAYYDGVWSGLEKYMGTADDAFEMTVKSLKDDIVSPAAGLTDDEAEAVTQLFDLWTDQVRLTRATRLEQRAAESALLTKTPPGKGRNDAWWRAFREAQSIPWRKWEGAMAVLKQRSGIQAAMVDNVLGQAGPPPPTIDAMGRVLTKMDVANLFHGHAKDIPKACLQTENMMLKGKPWFVAEVKGRAERMAQKAGRKADEMGWTDDAIGEVYDAGLRDMFIDPSRASVLEPRLMELESLRQELWHIYSSKGLEPGIVKAMNTRLGGLVDDLGKVPGYAAKVPEVVPTAIPKAELSKLAATRDFIIEMRRTGEPAETLITFLTDEVTLLKGYGIDVNSMIGLLKTGSKPSEIVDLVVSKIDNIIKLAKKPPKIPPPKPGVRGLADEFMETKQRAADSASKEYYKDWADYTNENVLTALGRTIYPFWVYEWHRLFWVPRQMLRTPGLFKAWGSYMNHTEDGYIHIPGTSLEANPLRGTIMMGGFIRLIRQDYPEYYDMFPGVSETLDYMSRFGFYPAAYINFLRAHFAMSAGGRPQYGELLPSLVKTPLAAYLALHGESKAAQALTQILLPDVYRDYMTMILASNICQTQEMEYSGRHIWDKLKEGEKLTEEEERIWGQATKQFGRYGIIMENAGILRIRAEQQVDAWEESGNLIEEKTGYTKEQQAWIRRHGFRVGDYAQLDPLDQEVLQELDAIKYWSGITLAMMPSTWQEEDRDRAIFWSEIRTLDDARKADREENARRVRAGEINMKAWSRRNSEINANFNTAFEALSNTNRFANIPISMFDELDEEGNVIREGLATVLETRGYLPPVMHPADEILHMYYQIELVEKFDPETETWYIDWDEYFWLLDSIIYTVDPERRPDLVSMITKNMDELTRLRWDVSKEYFRPYNRVKTALLELYSDKEKKLLRRFMSTPSDTERDTIRAHVTADGRQLVSAYQTDSRVIHENMRLLDPELDAWLMFFQITQTTLTPEAQRLYEQYRLQHGIRP